MGFHWRIYIYIKYINTTLLHTGTARTMDMFWIWLATLHLYRVYSSFIVIFFFIFLLFLIGIFYKFQSNKLLRILYVILKLWHIYDIYIYIYVCVFTNNLTNFDIYIPFVYLSIDNFLYSDNHFYLKFINFII